MKKKGMFVLLFVLAVAIAMPVWAAPPQNYGKIWTAYPEKDPLWNIYQGGAPIEWFPWANNYRFSIFTVVWTGNPNNMDIVLDHATGLVWQRRPLNLDPLLTPAEAQFSCLSLRMGQGYFMGWRLPLAEELLTLVDSYNSGGNTLPGGHPFIIGSGFKFWTATPDPTTPNYYLYVDFSDSGQPLKYAPKVARFNVWCVRGGGVAIASPSC